mgnify:CR=1 FL=1
MDVTSLLGAEAGALLGHTCAGIPRNTLTLPGPDFIERVMVPSDRNPTVLRNLGSLYGTGRLAGSGVIGLAIGDNPAFVLERCEIERDGPSYTLEQIAPAVPGGEVGQLVLPDDQEPVGRVLHRSLPIPSISIPRTS